MTREESFSRSGAAGGVYGVTNVIWRRERGRCGEPAGFSCGVGVIVERWWYSVALTRRV